MRMLAIPIFFAFFLVSCEHEKFAKQEDVFYTCSMDPQVVADKPGKCPICGMPLTPVNKSSVENTDEIELSDQQVRLGNILVDTIRKGTIGNKIDLTGTLNLNASQIATASARVMGRIEKLYAKSAGDYVAKGAPLYELYSEELNNAKQEYIAALQRRSLFADQALIDFDLLIESSKTKLLLWGMTPAQIENLEQQKQAPLTTTFYTTESGYITSLNVIEGGYVMEGGIILQLANLSTLWAEVQIYSTQLYQLSNGAPAIVHLPGTNQQIKGSIEFVDPEVESSTRINLIRVVVPNPGNQWKPGMSVMVTVQTASRNSLSLPTDAVIRDARGATVWIQTGKNKYRSQMVTTGIESADFVEIISGVKEGEIVVVRGTYLLHSEFVFKRGTDPMAGHNH